MKKDTIVFDFDGTLLYTLDDLRNSVNTALEHFGYPIKTLDEIRAFVGNGVGVLVAKSLPDGEDNPDYQQVLKHFTEDYIIHCNDNTRPYDGVLDMLKDLKSHGFKLAIVSNKFDSAVKELCKIYFDDIIDAPIGESESNRRKPEPDMVFTALEILDSSPEEAVYVGDTPVDYATSVNAGLDCICVTWGYRDKSVLKEAGATTFIDKPSELLDLLQ